jgi:hypothetical protein
VQLQPRDPAGMQGRASTQAEGAATDVARRLRIASICASKAAVLAGPGISINSIMGNIPARKKQRREIKPWQARRGAT